MVSFYDPKIIFFLLLAFFSFISLTFSQCIDNPNQNTGVCITKVNKWIEKTWVNSGEIWRLSINYHVFDPVSSCELTLSDVFFSESEFFPFSVIPAFNRITVLQVGSKNITCSGNETWASDPYKLQKCPVKCDKVGDFEVQMRATFFSESPFGGYHWEQNISWSDPSYGGASPNTTYNKSLYLLGQPVKQSSDYVGQTIGNEINSYYYYEVIRNTTAINFHCEWDSSSENICLYSRRSHPPEKDNWLEKICTNSGEHTLSVAYRLGIRADVLGAWYFGVQSESGKPFEYELTISVESPAPSLRTSFLVINVWIIISLIFILNTLLYL